MDAMFRDSEGASAEEVVAVAHYGHTMKVSRLCGSSAGDSGSNAQCFRLPRRSASGSSGHEHMCDDVLPRSRLVSGF